MKKFVKQKGGAFLAISSLLSLPSITLATRGGGWQAGKQAAQDGSGLPSGVDLPSALRNILYIGALLLGSLGVLGFIIAGIIYVTSAGNEERMEMAKRAMMYSIIGVVVGALGFVAVNAVDNLLLDGTGGQIYVP